MEKLRVPLFPIFGTGGDKHNCDPEISLLFLYLFKKSSLKLTVFLDTFEMHFSLLIVQHPSVFILFVGGRWFSCLLWILPMFFFKAGMRRYFGTLEEQLLLHVANTFFWGSRLGEGRPLRINAAGGEDKQRDPVLIQHVFCSSRGWFAIVEASFHMTILHFVHLIISLFWKNGSIRDDGFFLPSWD